MNNFNLDDANLVGRVSTQGDWTAVECQLFLQKLEAFMKEHRIHKIDIGWKMPEALKDY